MRIHEVSENSLKGSFDHNLNISKLWACQELKKLMYRYDIKRWHTIYCLGSWYGNMGLFMVSRGINFRTCINVEINANVLKGSQDLAKELGVEDKFQYMLKNANSLDYRQAREPTLIINQSTNDMRQSGWFANIPRGSVVLLQGRSKANSIYEFNHLDDFSARFPLRKTYFIGASTLKDPDGDYQRYMKIGMK